MEEVTFFTSDEIDYIEKNYELLAFNDMCKSLRTKILLRTGKTYSNSMIINRIRKMKVQKKKHIFEVIDKEKPDKEKLKNISINRI